MSDFAWTISPDHIRFVAVTVAMVFFLSMFLVAVGFLFIRNQLMKPARVESKRHVQDDSASVEA